MYKYATGYSSFFFAKNYYQILTLKIEIKLYKKTIKFINF